MKKAWGGGLNVVLTALHEEGHHSPGWYSKGRQILEGFQILCYPIFAPLTMIR